MARFVHSHVFSGRHGPLCSVPLRSLMALGAVAGAALVAGVPAIALSQEDVAVATALVAAPASAPTSMTPTSVAPIADGAGEAAHLFDTSPLPDADLAATTGREQNNWLQASANNSAVVRNNEIGDNSVTGSVSISDSAFQNVSGITMVNFNTGNASSINAAMSVNLQINYASPGL